MIASVILQGHFLFKYLQNLILKLQVQSVSAIRSCVLGFLLPEGVQIDLFLFKEAS